uniref:Uncharacterized protein LOC105033651 isoform X2 n=1 Tax=Elaeis guineensis var. tenera TaxID=51953 RepID=A0A8N4F0R1_ELAGV|nr:uncharacterized protein LOC105033651 isoform X2 [Elaeis guineensis]
MAEAISESISFFRSQLENRRFGDATLRILESVLVSKDVLSLLETRSALRYLLRSEAISVVREISQKTADEKLCAVEFFVRAFALVGDVESCLALKYEALVLRETKYLKGHGLQVLHEEWLTFAKDSLDNGFYAIAVKELPVHQRADAVSSLVYEANARMRDPVYGCVGAISFLQNKVSQLQMQLAMAQAEILCIQMQQEPSISHQQLDTDDKSFLLHHNIASFPQFMNFASSSNVVQESLKIESLWT